MTSRRQFLAFATGIGGTMALGTAAALLRGKNSYPRSSAGKDREGNSAAPSVVGRTAWALGADVSITALHADSGIAEQALEAAFAELNLIEDVMSIYRPQSQLSQLNRQRTLDDPHPYLLEVLQAAQEMALRTGGAFDVTVQPLWELFAAYEKRGELPTESQIEDVQRRVNWRHVQILPGRIRLVGAKTTVTLNGIAQGFAADKALDALRARGVTQALINTGEISSLGKNRDGQPWTVGIQHPRRPDAFLSLAKLAGRCLATSGDYATRFSDDFQFHHIFDPRTGRSPTELASVSIAAPTAMQADALSTAVFVLGPERGSDFVRATTGADALFVLKDGRTLVTDGFAMTSRTKIHSA